MSENLAAWFLYVLSVLGCCLVWWRLLFAIKLKQTAWVSTVILACILLAPSRVIQEMGYWAPAFMGALLELVASTPQGLQPHLLSMLIGLLVGCLLVLVVIRSKVKQRALAAKKDGN